MHGLSGFIESEQYSRREAAEVRGKSSSDCTCLCARSGKEIQLRVRRKTVETMRSPKDSRAITESVWKERALSASRSHYSSLLQNQFTSGMKSRTFQITSVTSL